MTEILTRRLDGDAVVAAAPPSGIDAATHNRLILPGMINCHSHVFQRAMAGMAEQRGASTDSFWTWREAMYSLAGRLTPAQLTIIADYTYLLMLKRGYTHVCEFHYLHRPRTDGTGDPREMSQVLIDSARRVGIGMTLLPVFYSRGGFDDRPLGEEQRRFALSLDEFLALVDDLQSGNPTITVGHAIHSLRAANHEQIQAIAAHSTDRPIHIHIAEQMREVDECVATLGARPVQWLADQIDLDSRWCLIHATHVNDQEVHKMTESDVVVGICPTTEANLGDGLFPLADFLETGGRFAIGSDSNVCVDAFEELRWLEYGQRLRDQSRNVVANANQHTGNHLWTESTTGGQQIAGGTTGESWIVMEASEFDALPAEQWVDQSLFAIPSPAPAHVYSQGRWVIRDGRHEQESAITTRYFKLLKQLWN